MTTAVFPVAGRGTRFLPATKASPKEMLPVVDKPLIQYAVEEAIQAGATRLVFVTGSSKRAIEDHFDTDAGLEAALAAAGKDELLQIVRDIVPSSVTCIYIRQGEPLGLGHAVLCARAVVGNEPFFVHLADDLIDAADPVLLQMRRQYEAHGCGVLGVETIPVEHSASYGIVAVETNGAGHHLIRQIVEKPKPENAPSNLAVVGRYLLPPEIFDRLEHTGRGAGGEIQLTDAIADLLETHPVAAYPFQGVRYDCGSKLGYLKATVELGLRHRSLGPEFATYLRELVARTAPE
ncbi:MAG: UTP--glucose-1-phosphate uridylyltransferase GalU [Gammaproteobacteria bacterium]|nr:UTP--glucose-1-phosphate uridylyltransferase GalU [Gammaproteobacteria bacterium]TVQ46176.1 MAG: UTP--glucose-1-phosphate uridylyltransferase [Gammaproteobacteria bacterium]